MLLPTLRQLQYLKLLAEHGSFSRAAEAAHVTQPTLSAGVAELEKVLGAPVVDRNRAGVNLTAVGEEAVARAGEILALSEDLVQAARSAGQPLTGRFRLGVIPTIAPFLLPRALPILSRTYPNLRLFLREDLTAKLIASLKAGAIDAALIALPYDLQGLDHIDVFEDPFFAVAPANHAMAAERTVDPKALEGADLILLEDGHCLRDHALSACSMTTARGGPEGAFAATSLHTLIQMVGSGLGVTLLPKIAVESGLADQAPVVVRPLNAGAPCREVVVAWRSGSSRGRDAKLLARTFRTLNSEASNSHLP